MDGLPSYATQKRNKKIQIKQVLCFKLCLWYVYVLYVV